MNIHKKTQKQQAEEAKSYRKSAYLYGDQEKMPTGRPKLAYEKKRVLIADLTPEQKASRGIPEWATFIESKGPSGQKSRRKFVTMMIPRDKSAFA